MSSKIVIVNRDSYPSASGHISTVTYPHPRTSLPLNLLSTSTSLLEVNSLTETPHASFIKDSEIVSNGNFHVLTGVDPLMLLLGEIEVKGKSFGPLEQIKSNLKESISHHIVDKITDKNITNVTSQYNIGDDAEPELMYKYSQTSTLDYLKSKYSSVLSVLTSHNSRTDTTVKSGSFASDFKLDSDDIKENEPSNDTDKTDKKKVDPLQLAAALHVCEYLTSETSKAFLEHVSLPLFILNKPKNSNKRKSWEAHDEEAEKLLNFGKSEGGEIEKKKPKPGENRKEELNKKAAKGMKSMSAFFMVKKK
ncbi:hypothetical protein TrLO_g10846 [Triparma laevis f. longispina]|uniref:Ribonuclease H2 subunit B wHTH domain-containing protein n=1 Tax=Triparma laevis f. longispina TaxID=1714387 RepID=A0A9W7KZ38_9STRA|nr:hypothetical protein TrLO_g10846 [Triparma laevis f. longispina]